MNLPRYNELFNPTLGALRELGGSGSIQEIVETVIQQMGLPDDAVQQLHGNGPQTELEYRLAWSRTYLKSYGLLTNSQRGVWALTEEGKSQHGVDPVAVRRYVIEQSKNNSKQVEPRASDSASTESQDPSGELTPEEQALGSEDVWRDDLLNALQNMDPSAFERFCQRVLRESGFIDVRVTGRSGDGGIDGVGLIRFAGLIGFPVLFQCKRYSGNSAVTAREVRDFRGAMTGRADRGLIITTGRFTSDAQREAIRDGAPPIDLINGELLVDKLKELGLGVNTKLIEVVEVDIDFFTNI